LISSSQIKAARALIGWTSALLAEKSGVGLMTVRRYEAVSGIPDGRVAQLMKVKNALEAAGVEFLGDPVESPGVRLRPKP
jgi:transcriptional regulator with XRE-family HTH domain